MMTNTRKLAYIAILSAISFLLMYVQFPLIPGADFLKFDFSIFPILVGLVILNLPSALVILILRSCLHLLLNNSGPATLIGMPMNIIAFALFICALAWIWVKNPTRKNYFIAAVVGTIVLTLAMLLLNFVYAAPLYATFANFDVRQFFGMAKYLFAMVLPFNLVQGALFTVIFYVLYAGLRPILKKI